MTLVQKPTTTIPKLGESQKSEEAEDMVQQMRSGLDTRQTGASGGNYTEYLPMAADKRTHGHGVQSNQDLSETLKEELPGVPKITMGLEQLGPAHASPAARDAANNIKSSQFATSQVHSSQTAKPATGSKKAVPPVDFMDMNKTMINFQTQVGDSITGKDSSIEENRDAVGSPTSKMASAKVQMNAAFRHTEYAKGFYKVKGQQATQRTPNRSSIQESNTEEPLFSEVERSNVLENQSRKPLNSKMFSKVAAMIGEKSKTRTAFNTTAT